MKFTQLMCAMLATGIHCPESTQSFQVDGSEIQYNGTHSPQNSKLNCKRCTITVVGLMTLGLGGITYWLSQAQKREDQSTDPVVSYETTTSAMSNTSSNATTTAVHNVSLNTTTAAQSVNASTAQVNHNTTQQPVRHYLRSSFHSIAQ